MRLFNIILITVLFTANVPAQDCKAILHISSDSDSAEYYLNNTKIGEGRILISEQDIGQFILLAREKGNEWDPVIFSDTINIQFCKEYSFQYNFFSGKYIQTDPEKVSVYRNDSLLGITPLYIESSGIISLKKPGYIDYNADLKNIHGILQMQHLRNNNKNKSFYEKDLFKYLIGGLVILGGATAYFKLEADDKFEEYELTGEDKLLKETRKYDLISGITFGALQINFGLLLYYFLSE